MNPSYFDPSVAVYVVSQISGKGENELEFSKALKEEKSEGLHIDVVSVAQFPEFLVTIFVRSDEKQKQVAQNDYEVVSKWNTMEREVHGILEKFKDKFQPFVYFTVYYVVNSKLQVPAELRDVFETTITGIRLAFSESTDNPKLGNEVGKIWISAKSFDVETQVLELITEILPVVLISYSNFLMHYVDARKKFGRGESGDDTFKVLRKRVEEIERELEPVLLREVDKNLLEQMDAAAVKLAEIYDALNAHHTAMLGDLNTMRIHLKNLQRYSFSGHQIVPDELLNIMQVRIEQVEHDLLYVESLLRKIQNRLDTIKLRVESFRSGESFRMQRESFKMQRAAEIIEFIIVMYYFTHLWEVYAPETFEHAGWWKVLVAAGFSGSVTILTDLLVDLVGFREEFSVKKVLVCILTVIVFIAVLLIVVGKISL